MTWPLTAGALAAVLLFIVARIWVRRRITNRWLDDVIPDRLAAVLFGLTYLAPMLLVLVIAFVTSPSSAPTLLFVLAFFLAPMLALGIGLMDYAAQHGVKESMRKDRAARRRTTAKASEQTDVP